MLVIFAIKPFIFRVKSGKEPLLHFWWFRVYSLGLKVEGIEFHVKGSRVQGWGFRVEALRFTV